MHDAEPGTVYLVGAGPGDPGLLTLKAARLLADADVVVHDRLAERSLMDLARGGVERIDVGKAPGGPVHQDEINRLLVEKAKLGLRVIRLKGGDPFVFGRGGEEILALQAAGVPFEVVPGVTSAVAVPAYAGIPVTHRGLSTSFTVVTGHTRHQVDAGIPWEVLAHAGGTLVILMGVVHRAEIARRLMAAGMPPSTPVAAVTWGTRSEQTSVRATLADLGEVAVSPPATIVIGAVAGLDLRWWESRPLLGRHVVLVRDPARTEVGDSLRHLGASVTQFPLIEVELRTSPTSELAQAATRMSGGAYDWVVFTSAHAVEALHQQLPDGRQWAQAMVGSIGPSTSEALRKIGIVADLEAGRSSAAQLADALLAHTSLGRALWPAGNLAAGTLVDRLEDKGWEVTRVEAYSTSSVAPGAESLQALEQADAVVFSSPSAIRAALEAGASLQGAAVAIGATTAAAMTESGVAVAAVAESQEAEAVIAAVLTVLR